VTSFWSALKDEETLINHISGIKMKGSRVPQLSFNQGLICGFIAGGVTRTALAPFGKQNFYFYCLSNLFKREKN